MDNIYSNLSSHHSRIVYKSTSKFRKDRYYPLRLSTAALVPQTGILRCSRLVTCTDGTGSSLHFRHKQIRLNCCCWSSSASRSSFFFFSCQKYALISSRFCTVPILQTASTASSLTAQTTRSGQTVLSRLSTNHMRLSYASLW